jgi:hypothetical protein
MLRTDSTENMLIENFNSGDDDRNVRRRIQEVHTRHDTPAAVSDFSAAATGGTSLASTFPGRICANYYRRSYFSYCFL